MKWEGRKANSKQKLLTVAWCDTPQGLKSAQHVIAKRKQGIHGDLSYHLLQRLPLCTEASRRQHAQCPVPCTLMGGSPLSRSVGHSCQFDLIPPPFSMIHDLYLTVCSQFNKQLLYFLNMHSYKN